MADAPFVHPDGLVMTERHDGVTVVTMNDGERRNSLSTPMRRALLEGLGYLMNEDGDTRVIVLTGGTDNFAAGDYSAATLASSDFLGARDQATLSTRLFSQIHTGSKPVVMAVEGNCTGSGLSLACAGDIVVAGNGTRFACDFVKMGLMPDMGLIWSLPKKVGPARARRLMLDGRTFAADAALDWGVVSEVVPAGQALKASVEKANRLAALPLPTLALLKGALVYGMNTVADARREEIDLNPLVRQTADHAEAVSAFLEKRAPVFKND